ncbi:MAG: sigma-70 family RNA polymerase sigma factor [Planctomycetota bacterium]
MNPSTVLVDNRRWLWLVVYSRLGDAAQAEDVMQEVAVAAVRTDIEFPEAECGKHWLYRVAVRQVMLFRRSQARHRRKLQNFQRDIPAVDAPDCVQWICAGETNGQVREALARLKPGDQEILAMKYGEDFSCREIARVMGVTETTIQSRLLRARKRLRQLLVSEYQFEAESDD